MCELPQLTSLHRYIKIKLKTELSYRKKGESEDKAKLEIQRNIKEITLMYADFYIISLLFISVSLVLFIIFNVIITIIIILFLSPNVSYNTYFLEKLFNMIGNFSLTLQYLNTVILFKIPNTYL